MSFFTQSGVEPERVKKFTAPVCPCPLIKSSQRAEVRRQKAEGRGQRAEGRGQKSVCLFERLSLLL